MGCSDVSHIRLGPKRETQEDFDARYQKVADEIIHAVKAQREKPTMSVRAKFTYTGYESSLSSSLKDGKKYGDPDAYEQVEMRTLKFAPVYGNNDPNHENTKFWKSSPSGSISLGTINPEAWKHFELGKEYYIDFTPAS